MSRQRSWQATRTCSAEEEEGLRKRAYGKDSVKRRQLWRSLRRFWQLLQPGAFIFFGNNVLLTTVWNLSIDVSFNLQDGRTLLTCPSLVSWTAFVCACNGGRTRRASKGDLELRRLWLGLVTFGSIGGKMLTPNTSSGVSFWAIDNDKDVTKDRNLNTFKMYCKRRKSGVRFIYLFIDMFCKDCQIVQID